MSYSKTRLLKAIFIYSYATCIAEYIININIINIIINIYNNKYTTFLLHLGKIDKILMALKHKRSKCKK